MKSRFPPIISNRSTVRSISLTLKGFQCTVMMTLNFGPSDPFPEEEDETLIISLLHYTLMRRVAYCKGTSRLRIVTSGPFIKIPSCRSDF